MSVESRYFPLSSAERLNRAEDEYQLISRKILDEYWMTACVADMFWQCKVIFVLISLIGITFTMFLFFYVTSAAL